MPIERFPTDNSNTKSRKKLELELKLKLKADLLLKKQELKGVLGVENVDLSIAVYNENMKRLTTDRTGKPFGEFEQLPTS